MTEILFCFFLKPHDRNVAGLAAFKPEALASEQLTVILLLKSGHKKEDPEDQLILISNVYIIFVTASFTF
jgi:hypothetical protein